MELALYSLLRLDTWLFHTVLTFIMRQIHIHSASNGLTAHFEHLLHTCTVSSKGACKRKAVHVHRMCMMGCR